MITSLKDNQFIVVGTNLAGQHGAGAAYQAYLNFGLEYGIGEGLSGQTYAFPTLERDMHQRGWKGLEAARDRFYSIARALPEKEFLMTPVGTGIAGYEPEYMKQLFINPPANVVLPDWNQNK
jgi:hypothetical protein